MRYGFGIDLGGTTVKLAYFDETGRLLDKWEIPTDTSDGGSRILGDIAGAVLGYLERNAIPRECIVGLGIGVPGPVDKNGNVNRCINLGWGVFNVEKELSDLTGLPVKAGNDANVAALGECWMGGGKGCSSMILATLGTGVGGGIIIDGKILCGAQGAGGEIGHMVLDPEEQDVCGCGKRGCVEQYCSATGIVRTAKKYLASCDTPSTLRALEKLTCKDVFDAAAAADAAATAILDTVYDCMAQFVANLCAVLNPETVVLGGGVSKAGQPLIDGVRARLGKYIYYACADTPVVLAQLGNDAGAYGAFKLVLDR
ncbi:MAG: ROK family glucokinase [Oscillospiraceae bacterium]|nr:ROK family glucokinase [Oscillospiraceae bacterium]